MDVKSFILWYNSLSHGKTRYFVGSTKKKCAVHGSHTVPAWTYEKDSATILDGIKAGMLAKKFTEMCGYKNLTLEPIDEMPAKQKSQTVPQV